MNKNTPAYMLSHTVSVEMTTLAKAQNITLEQARDILLNKYKPCLTQKLHKS